jgi:hypothetical protein
LLCLTSSWFGNTHSSGMCCSVTSQ